MDHHSYELPITDRNTMQQRNTSHMTTHNDLIPPTVHFMNDMMFNALAMPSTASEMYTFAPLQCQPIESDTTNPNLSQHLHPYIPNTSTPANALLTSEDDSRLVDDIMSAFDTSSVVNEPLYAAPLYTQPPPSYLVRQTQSSHAEQIAMSHPQHTAQQLSMQSMMTQQEIPVVPLRDHHSGAIIPQMHDPAITDTQLSPMRTRAGKNKSSHDVASTYRSTLQDPTHSTRTNSAIMISMSESIATHQTENPYLAVSTTSNSLIPMDACDFSSDHSSTSLQPINSHSYLQDTLPQSSSKTPSNKEALDDKNDKPQKITERRRQQVRFASRRRRKKQKDEESSLRVRIEELKEQIQIIGGDLSEQSSQMASMNEEALKDAHDKQLVTVQNLRKDNEKLKEQLVQHENFERIIQHGLNSLPNDCRDDDQRKRNRGTSPWSGDHSFGNSLRGPTLVVDLNICHEAVREAYDELKRFGPSVNAKLNVLYAIKWKLKYWVSGTSLSFRARRPVTDKNISDVARDFWKIMISPEKSKRMYPNVKHFRVLQKVTDDIFVVHRIASVGSEMIDREFISIAFQFRDGNEYYIGIKSIDVQAPTSEHCIRGEECQGWKLTGSNDNSTQWNAQFLGYYDVKLEDEDVILNQIGNENMFSILRWEYEAIETLTI